MNFNINKALVLGIANKHGTASGKGGIFRMQKRIETVAPLARNIEKEDLAKFTAHLFSGIASEFTGDTDTGSPVLAH